MFDLLINGQIITSLFTKAHVWHKHFSPSNTYLQKCIFVRCEITMQSRHDDVNKKYWTLKNIYLRLDVNKIVSGYTPMGQKLTNN